MIVNLVTQQLSAKTAMLVIRSKGLLLIPTDTSNLAPIWVRKNQEKKK